MSGIPLSHGDHPPHGHPDNTAPSNAPQDKSSTASHPPSTKPDPTTSSSPPKRFHAPTEGGLAAAPPARAAELPGLKKTLKANLKQYPDFPSKGVLFEDILPLFADPRLHGDLIRALELQTAGAFSTSTGEASGVDVVVGLESRGFLFGPGLARALGAGFVPVRKTGKLPGQCVKEGFEKEYGRDEFEMQVGAIGQGKKVVVVDDIIATGGSAEAAGKLVRKLGGDLLGYVFIMELDFLKGREKLDAPVHTLLSGQEEGIDGHK